MEDFLLVVASAEEEAVAVDSKVEVIKKQDLFNQELDYIKNDRIRESASILVNLIPDYFFHEAASSTGKYHPAFSQGDGGLLRHTKAAVRIAKEILTTKTFGNTYTNDEKDLIYLALIMHDSIKRGDNEQYTRFDHPLLASKFILENADKIKLTDDEINLLCSMIETHMGEWVNDYFGNKVLEEPVTKYQKMVHLCDYLSAKKFLDIKFDNDNNIIY